ncbi:methylcytosine dioxygenase TET2 [Kryptolebias marmoratus]|uniref:Methylcytosine dioxygenase TET n=2 Tax=Kryptolebias marmoratus TaxID=37003 RepID=A0A3Q2ZTL7_KRYMA|nr:methylcytosine dioxygenase TET2 [Kryptolebias marmoratus]XP_024863851.1 methylcytosine dioxygenase TET2 [Kryptolebias marmoratus]
METEQAKHETEESLMLAQFGTSCNFSHKLQNGAQSSEEDSLQITEDTNWITHSAHYKPSKGVSSVKQHRENCNMPVSEQGLSKMNGDLTNGELNHALSEQSLLVHQAKKMKVDVESRENVDAGYNLVIDFSESESSSQRTETSFDKRNCHIPNGDIFCLPRNKQVPNGAVSSSSTIESTPGDLLEKTLSQYYPEQVSIAPQTSGSQLDTVNDSLTNQLSSEGAQPTALTSGFQTNSSHMPDLQQQQSGTSANAEGDNSYNSGNYSVNGYSHNFEADHQQQQHHHLQQQPSYSGQELALEPLPDMVPPLNNASSSQHPNGGQCFSNDTNPQGEYIEAQQEFNPSSFVKRSNPLHTAETGGYGSFHNSGLQETKQNEKSGTGQILHRGTGRGQHYGSQTQSFQENVGKQQRDDGLGHMGPGLQQPHHIRMENGMENTQQRTKISCSTPSQTSWIDGKPSQSQQQPTSGPSSQAQEHDMWRGFPGKPLPEQQTESPQVCRQLLEPKPLQLYRETQTQGVFTDSSQRSNSSQQKQEDCLPSQRQCASLQHNTAPEWQQSNPKTPQTQQTLLQKMSEQRNFPPNQQAETCYQSQMETEHLHEDNDLQDILSAGFVTAQQQQQQQQEQQHCLLQRPLSHPPQFEGQQLKSPNYRPHSQPPPGAQLQTDQPLRNNFIQPNNQDTHPIDQPMFTYNNTREMQQPQPQKQYFANSSSKNLKQFQPQQSNNHCHETNQVDFPQTSTQSQPHLPQGLVNQQVTTQMYLKAEQQMKTSCTQFQMGPRLPLGPLGPHGDTQRHAALRMHLLQKQERHGSPHPLHGSNDPKQIPRGVKIENGPRFELPASRQQEQLLQMREPGMGGIHIKQENQQPLCVQNKKQGSILASMEQSLRQYQLSPVFEKKSVVVNSSNKVKVESSGPVTILSTNTDMNGVDSSAGVSSTITLKKMLDSTPKKEQLLKSFIDSPIKLLDTPIKNLLDTPMKTQYEIPSCHCVDQIIEKDEGPYYTHLGSAPSVAGIREEMEKRSGLTGRAIRIEKVIYTGKEGKSTQGCPIAKWVIRRSSVEEKLLVLVRERTGHRCDSACIIVVILVWEGIQPSLADRLYLELSETLTKHGALTQRRCAFNEERTCACQGLNPEACGASFSFGCSWSMYYNGCKFARSKIPRKFKLLIDDAKEEEKIERNFQNLAALLAPLYKTMAPEAYGNQVEYEHRAPDCRLGIKEGRPFSGVTACMDFCAHAHRDLHNMQGGSTVVCTLTREDNREIGKIPEDEQLHVLPLYKPSNTDEFGSEEGQQEKIKAGAIQVLSAFRRQVRMLAEPAKSCRQKKLDAKKAAANKNAMLESSNDKAEKALQAKSKAGTYENNVQSTLLAGAVGATLQSGHPSYPLGAQPQQIQQQQHQGIFPPYPAPTNAAVARFSNHPGPFPSTSKPGSMFNPQPPSPASPYLSTFHIPNSYMNGSNRPYPSHQCNGGMPIGNYHPLYAASQKHPDMYGQQRATLYSEQQYGVHRFDVNYPPRYSEPGLQVNGYNPIRPTQPMTHYSPYGPNRTQFIDPLLRAPSSHGGIDYTLAVSKGNQFGEYPNPYLPQSPHVLPPGQDPFHMQIKTEMGMPGPLSAQLSTRCVNPESQAGLGRLNGGVLGSSIKQEPGTPQTPTTPQKPELWSDNEHNFLDPDIGGVAVAPTHGSVLIECAKRELHATTPLKNPDRNHPTRISLVFYQHKNLNEAKHGLAMWEAKMADKAREKEEEAERNGGEGTPSKGSKKGVKREHSDSSETTGEPPYKRFIKALMEGSSSCTTNTYAMTTPYAFTKVTGPYNQFV